MQKRLQTSTDSLSAEDGLAFFAEIFQSLVCSSIPVSLKMLVGLMHKRSDGGLSSGLDT